MKRYLITQRQGVDKHGVEIDFLEQTYVEYFERFNFSLQPISNSIKLDSFLNKQFIEGIILSGGEDIDFNSKRYALEKKLIDFSIKNDVPVLGICRGMQMINVYFEGQLTLAISKIDSSNIHQVAKPHKIAMTCKDLEVFNRVPVNSYHNCAVLKQQLGKDLVDFALFEPLNIVEGLFHKNFPIAGIQWHPERPNGNDLLNEYLINAFKNRELFWKK